MESAKNQKEKKDKQKRSKGKTNKDMEKIKERCEEFENKYKRILADYDNLLKRQAKEKENLVKMANQELIQDVVPVFDNLKLSLEHVGEKDKDNSWVQGVEYVVKQFREVLEDHGLEEMKVEDTAFDPNKMEAVDGEGDHVYRVVKPGYSLKGEVVIPAKVVLSQEKKENKPQDQDKESQENKNDNN